MNLDQGGDSETRFAEYVAGLGSVIGHVERTRPLRDYCTGLMLPGERKSVEPMAARTAPARTAAQHQSLLHFVANATWSDEDVLAKVREMVLPAIEKSGPIEAWIIDDTSYPKQGSHSVGVHHQYCGQLGKQANCQVAVTLSIANHHASLPVAYRLYLPQDWADDAARRKKAHVPAAIAFATKPQIALEQIRAACAAGVPRGVVLMDASYGSNTALRESVSALALRYMAAIVPTVKVRAVSKRGAPEPRVSVKELALGLPKQGWRIERDYQELKQEIGLGHFEGRGWPGFHHHGTLCIAAYGFLISERETIPPSGPRCPRRLTKSAIPGGYRPRGAPDPAATSHPQLD